MSVLERHSVKLLGQGEQLVVLSHGLGFSQEAWRGILPYLLPHYRVLLYNLRGHSSQDSDNFDISRYRSVQGFVDDLLAILSELKIDKCIYVGHSVSGMIGCLASVARPQTFQKLILIGASPRYLNDAGYEGGFEQHDVEQILQAIDKDCTTWVSGFVPFALGPEATEEAVQDYTSSFLRLKPEFTRVVAEAIFMSDFRKNISLVTVPCHVIQTKEDFAVPLAVAKYLQQKLRGQLQVMESRGHLPHVTCPHLLAPLLGRILQQE